MKFINRIYRKWLLSKHDKEMFNQVVDLAIKYLGGLSAKNDEFATYYMCIALGTAMKKLDYEYSETELSMIGFNRTNFKEYITSNWGEMVIGCLKRKEHSGIEWIEIPSPVSERKIVMNAKKQFLKSLKF